MVQPSSAKPWASAAMLAADTGSSAAKFMSTPRATHPLRLLPMLGERQSACCTQRSAAQILTLEAIAVRVLIGVFVEVRHFGSRPTAGDHLDQLLAVKARLVQIGRPAGRAWIATPVAIDAMAKLAVRLVAEQALAERHVLGLRRAETEDDDRRGDNKVASLHEHIPEDGDATIMRTPSSLTVRTRTAWSGCAFREVPAYL